ncbi:MAG: hypothetical protein JSS51_14490 [Planctomycetes bacterium]|nr:hypothetical protein [Planctomycetota bacterium]
MSEQQNASEQITRLQEAVAFLEHRQDEFVAALDDLSGRLTAALKKISTLEQQSDQLARRMQASQVDQAGPGQSE